MNWKLVFAIFIWMWALARGALEGWVWADDTRKATNKIIGIDIRITKGLVDYHGWRNIEALSMLMAMTACRFLVSWTDFFMILIGAYLTGIYGIYERVLNQVVFKNIFYADKKKYTLMGYDIPTSIVVDYVLFSVGACLLYFNMTYM